MCEQRRICSLAVGIALGAFWVPRSVVARGIDVCRAAWEDERLHRFGLRSELVVSQSQRNFHGLPAGQAHRFTIPVVLATLSAKLFFSCAIRDTDARLLAGLGCHTKLILPSTAHSGNRKQVRTSCGFQS